MKKVIIGLIIIILLVSGAVYWALIYNISYNHSSADHVEKDDLLIMVAREGYYGPNYKWIYILKDKTTYLVVTEGAGQTAQSLSSEESDLANQLLSLSNNSRQYDPPVDLDKKRISDSLYQNIMDMVIASNFTTNQSLDGCCDEGYYQIIIFLDGYEKRIRYYSGNQPNEQTQILADTVLDIWD